MIQELPVTALTNLTDIFPGPQLALVRAAIVSGNTEGRLWLVADEGAEKSAFLWDRGNNVFYFGGASLASSGVDALAALIAATVQAQATAEGARYFRARGLTPEFHALVPRLLPGVSLEHIEKRFYRYSRARAPVVGSPRTPGLAILPLGREFLQSDRENLEEVVSELAWMWPGSREDAVARFLAHGFGAAAVVGNRVVCWCTAGYVSGNRSGTGIETVADYRRQGIATATAAHFIAAALDRGVQPYWECGSANVPSVRLATRLGFEELEVGDSWVGVFARSDAG